MRAFTELKLRNQGSTIEFEGFDCKLEFNEKEKLATIKMSPKMSIGMVNTILYEQRLFLGRRCFWDNDGIKIDVDKPEDLLLKKIYSDEESGLLMAESFTTN